MEYRLFSGPLFAFFVVFLLFPLNTVCADLSYNFPEETKRQYVIGNIANGLRIDVKQLSARKARIDTEDSKRYCEINLNTGDLIVTETIDREELCGSRMSCILSYELVLENPLEVHRIILQIQDINDNAPRFPNECINFEIGESAVKGQRFRLDEAHDKDIGQHDVNGYSVEKNKQFVLDIQDSADGGKYAELVLEKELDREQQKEIDMILTATDGGSPQRSGTAVIHITVLDANDNVPVFSESVYKVTLAENTPSGTEIIRVSATDADEGPNGEVTYEFSRISDKAVKLFSIDKTTGQIMVVGEIDYENEKNYEMIIQSKDASGLASTAKIIIDITDVNDNSPRIILKSLNNPVPENSEPGTEVGIINVQDKDSGENRQIRCSVQQNVPFKLNPSVKNDFSLVTTKALDREKESDYNITITATDGGSPPLSTSLTIQLFISDVIAVDADSGQNAWLSYQIVKSTDPGLFSIGLHSGEIKTQRYISESDNMKQNLVISVKDNGQPSLSTTCAVNVLISDNLSEVPELKDMTYEDSNSKLTSYLIIALVSVSTFFLTFIILIVAVKFCHRRKPRLLFDGAVAVPSAYIPPNYAEVDGFIMSYNENTIPFSQTLCCDEKTTNTCSDTSGEGLKKEKKKDVDISAY
uniref:Protocadherin 1 gamma 2 n=1 Tax=Sinocyclocheilus rhinocerous TaxID=307959 RepID=A0A673KCS3_9TELE